MTPSPSAGSPLQTPAVNQVGPSPIPFRAATTERVNILPSETNVAMTANEQVLERTVDGSGYLYGIRFRVVAAAAANSATVAYQEDAPWSALSSVVLRDVNAELVNVSGYDLYVANLVNRGYAVRYIDQSTNTNLFQQVSGSGGTGGSFTFVIDAPLGTNRRDLRGVLGNQDRAQKYFIKSNIAGSAAVYSTAPSVLPNVTIEKYYQNYSIPLPTAPNGVPQQVLPDHFGTIHYLTATLSDSAPLGGSTVNHYLRRIGNTVRWIALVFRSNSSRSTAETNAPTTIQFKVGEDVLFNETYNYRKSVMYDRYGFDFPNGVLVYETLHDFAAAAGFEVGDDYWHTQALVNAQFQINYPSGFGSTSNSLKIITDDLQYVEPSAGVAVSA